MKGNSSKGKNDKDRFVLVAPGHQSRQQNKVSALLQITDSDDSDHDGMRIALFLFLLFFIILIFI